MSSIAKTNSAFNSFKNFFSTIFAVDKDEKDVFDEFINGSNEEDAKIALELQASLLDIEKNAEELMVDSKPKKKKSLSLNNKIKLEKTDKQIVKENDERDISK